jgi:hypothetical protein
MGVFVIAALAKALFDLCFGKCARIALLSPLYTIFYGSLIQGAAVMGLIDPFRARKVIAQAEIAWSQHDCFLGESTTLAPCFRPKEV